MLALVPEDIKGFDPNEFARFEQLLDQYNKHISANEIKNKYYEGKIRLSDVNLGIAIPDTFNKLEIGCAWGAKTVDVLAARSMFDGFVGMSGEDVLELDKIVEYNNLIAEYSKACRDELKYGCTFATLSSGERGAKIRFHSPRTASALWDGEKGRVSCGFAIIDSMPSNDDFSWQPSLINYYTDDSVWTFNRISDSDEWYATRYTHAMGRPLIEPLIWNATSDKPFGRSRIKEPVRRLIEGYVRTVANATIGLEFATSPQKYLLGVTDEQYDTVIDQKFKQYVGSIIASTTNPETGEKPSFGQLPQGTISSHVEMVRVLATQFSAATGLSVTDTGVVSEANPTSADAVVAQSQTLVAMAEQLNEGNTMSLKTIALMAIAINEGVSLNDLSDEKTDIIPHFCNPAMPSVAASADAAIKIASAREGFANTDTFLEMIGFDKADIRRITAQERKNRGLQVVSGLEE